MRNGFSKLAIHRYMLRSEVYRNCIDSISNIKNHSLLGRQNSVAVHIQMIYLKCEEKSKYIYIGSCDVFSLNKRTDIFVYYQHQNVSRNSLNQWFKISRKSWKHCLFSTRCEYKVLQGVPKF